MLLLCVLIVKIQWTELNSFCRRQSTANKAMITLPLAYLNTSSSCLPDHTFTVTSLPHFPLAYLKPYHSLVKVCGSYTLQCPYMLTSLPCSPDRTIVRSYWFQSNWKQGYPGCVFNKSLHPMVFVIIMGVESNFSCYKWKLWFIKCDYMVYHTWRTFSTLLQAWQCVKPIAVTDKTISGNQDKED